MTDDVTLVHCYLHVYHQYSGNYPGFIMPDLSGTPAPLRREVYLLFLILERRLVVRVTLTEEGDVLFQIIIIGLLHTNHRWERKR